MTDADFRVEQPRFHGPIDLLLQLVKRREISAQEIKISEITEHYLEYIQQLQGIEIDRASQFLWLASILLELKARELLIDDNKNPIADEELEIPADLIKDLLAYRELRDQAEFLRALESESDTRFARGPVVGDDYGRFLEDLSTWDLYEAFAKLQRELANQAPRLIRSDETPIEDHMARIRECLKPGERVALERLFEDLGGITDRAIWIGRFLAILEMAKRQEIFIFQEQAFGKIEVEGRP